MPASEARIATTRLSADLATRLLDRDAIIDLARLADGTCLAGGAARLCGRRVLVATEGQAASGTALAELDGVADRLVIAPPDLSADDLAAVVADADVDAIATDDVARYAPLGRETIAISLPIAAAPPPPRRADTEWVMLTSGTSGRPKMVGHRLSALTGAIAPSQPGGQPTVWATFYDIRRYGGLQIFLRAVLGRSDIVLSSAGEPMGDHLMRLGAAGVTSISGTPSQWRRVLMSHERHALRPRYVRLSGEIADQMVLDALAEAFPDAAIGHAYASTEAGVGFAVDDGFEGFPASLLADAGPDIEMKIVDDTLRIRSSRTASRYIGRDAPTLADADGFVDTGDLVERRGERYVFVGRRGGIINVGGLKVNPEEVEAAINSHAEVRMSLVQARRNPLVGAIVVADIVLRDAVAESDALKDEILATCRARLARHKVPAILRFVPALALTPGGKLSRSAAR